MIVEIYAHGAFSPPIRVHAQQVVVRDDVGNPFMLAMAYGPDGTIRFSRLKDRDFGRLLEVAGITSQPPEVQMIKLPPPPTGAVLLAGPREETSVDA